LTDLQTRRAGLSASAELLVTRATLRVSAVLTTATMAGWLAGCHTPVLYQYG